MRYNAIYVLYNYSLSKTPCKATPPPSLLLSANSRRPSGKNSNAVTYHSRKMFFGRSKFLGFGQTVLFGEIVCNSRVMFLFRLVIRPKPINHIQQRDRQTKEKRMKNYIVIECYAAIPPPPHVNERLIGLCEGQSVQLYIPPPVVKLLSSMWRTLACTAGAEKLKKAAPKWIETTTIREQMETEIFFFEILM